jgi:hypothetical protein
VAAEQEAYRPAGDAGPALDRTRAFRRWLLFAVMVLAAALLGAAVWLIASGRGG